jgi:hypothetical protein
VSNWVAKKSQKKHIKDEKQKQKDLHAAIRILHPIGCRKFVSNKQRYGAVYRGYDRYVIGVKR